MALMRKRQRRLWWEAGPVWTLNFGAEREVHAGEVLFPSRLSVPALEVRPVGCRI